MKTLKAILVGGSLILCFSTAMADDSCSAAGGSVTCSPDSAMAGTVYNMPGCSISCPRGKQASCQDGEADPGGQYSICSASAGFCECD